MSTTTLETDPRANPNPPTTETLLLINTGSADTHGLGGRPLELRQTWFNVAVCKPESSNRANLPNNNNDEIEHVPTVSHVGVLVHHQTVSDDLQKGLDCENNEEGILNCFLEVQKKKREKTNRHIIISKGFNWS